MKITQSILGLGLAFIALPALCFAGVRVYDHSQGKHIDASELKRSPAPQQRTMNQKPAIRKNIAPRPQPTASAAAKNAASREELSLTPGPAGLVIGFVDPLSEIDFEAYQAFANLTTLEGVKAHVLNKELSPNDIKRLTEKTHAAERESSSGSGSGGASGMTEAQAMSLIDSLPVFDTQTDEGNALFKKYEMSDYQSVMYESPRGEVFRFRLPSQAEALFKRIKQYQKGGDTAPSGSYYY